jgi:AbrB family looped-hinge helix DNA binding protein
MTYRVGPKGQVVLPRELRDELGIRPGDEVVFGHSDDEITVRKAESKAEVVRRLRGLLAGPGPRLTDLLIEERRRDREREDRKFGEFS